MKIRVFDSPRYAGIYASTLLEQTILSLEQPVLGLATGSTMIPCYTALRGLVLCGLDLSKTITINLDEYIGLAESHPQSYHYFMENTLFRGLSSRPKEIHIPNGMAENLKGECERYDAIIQSYRADIQLLGIGTNGHIGFNEPSQSLLSHTHVVHLTEETISVNARFFDSVENVPKRAFTMGVQSILQARKIVLMAFGKGKADAVAKSVQGEVSTEIPASMLQFHPDVTLVLDTESASALPAKLWGGQAITSETK